MKNMDNVETKTKPSRRTKFLIIGLVVVILVLSFRLYKSYQQKNELVRRKSFYIFKYRDSKGKFDKLKEDVDDKARKIVTLTKLLATKQEELAASRSKLEDLSKTYEQKEQQLTQLEESASKNSAMLTTLKANYQNVTSKLTSMKENMDKQLESCNHIQDNNRAFEDQLKKKSAELSECLNSKKTITDEKTALVDNYKKQLELEHQRIQAGASVTDKQLNSGVAEKIERGRPSGSSQAIARRTRAPEAIQSSKSFQDAAQSPQIIQHSRSFQQAAPLTSQTPQIIKNSRSFQQVAPVITEAPRETLLPVVTGQVSVVDDKPAGQSADTVVIKPGVGSTFSPSASQPAAAEATQNPSLPSKYKEGETKTVETSEITETIQNRPIDDDNGDTDA